MFSKILARENHVEKCEAKSNFFCFPVRDQNQFECEAKSNFSCITPALHTIQSRALVCSITLLMPYCYFQPPDPSQGFGSAVPGNVRQGRAILL